MAQGTHLGQRDEEGNAIIIPTEIQLPEIPGPWSPLLGIFALSGQAMQSGMGLVPLDWKELRAFRKENKLDLTLWERELLKKMSEAYCGEYSRASDPHRPCPYVVEKEEDEIDHIATAMRFREQMMLLRGNKNES